MLPHPSRQPSPPHQLITKIGLIATPKSMTASIGCKRDNPSLSGDISNLDHGFNMKLYKSQSVIFICIQ